jgi:hypothetical protein
MTAVEYRSKSRNSRIKMSKSSCRHAILTIWETWCNACMTYSQKLLIISGIAHFNLFQQNCTLMCWCGPYKGNQVMGMDQAFQNEEHITGLTQVVMFCWERLPWKLLDFQTVSKQKKAPENGYLDSPRPVSGTSIWNTFHVNPTEIGLLGVKLSGTVTHFV